MPGLKGHERRNTQQPLLIAAAVCGALLSGLFTHFCIEDRYTAVSRMYMVSASTSSVVNLSDLNVGASLSNDYVELMKTRPVIEGVIDSLGLDYTYDNLINMISLSVVPNTRIVKISVTSTDPLEAMDIANEMARVSREQLPKVMDAPTPSIAEPAILPEHKSYPSMRRNIAAGTLAALFAVMGVLTVLYLLDDTIRTSEDFEREFGIIPMTVIPEGVIEGFVKSEDSRAGRRFPLPGLPIKRRRKEEFVDSWTSVSSVRISEKEAIPIFEPVSLPMHQSEFQSQPGPSAPPLEPVEPPSEPVAVVAEPAELSVLAPVSHVELPVDGTDVKPAELPVDGTDVKPTESPELPVVGADVKPAESAKAAEKLSEQSSAASLEPVGSKEPPAAAAASSGEPAWKLVRSTGQRYYSVVPVWELMPAGQGSDRSSVASQNRQTFRADQSRSRTAGYRGHLYTSRRARRVRRKTLDYIFGAVSLLSAGLLVGLLFGQMTAPSIPVAKPQSSEQDVPVVVSQSASPQGTAADGTVKKYTQIVVFMDNMQHIVEERYTAQDGTVVRNEKGYAIVRNQYDPFGNRTRTAFYDENNNPVFVPDFGYSSVVMTYDGLGNKIDETYFNADGSPIVTP